MIDVVFNPNIVRFWRQGRHRSMKSDSQKFDLKPNQYQSVEQGYNSINIGQFGSLIQLTDQGRIGAYLIRKNNHRLWPKTNPVESSIKQRIGFLKNKRLSRSASIDIQFADNLDFHSIQTIASDLRRQINLSIDDQIETKKLSKLYRLIVNKFKKSDLNVVEVDLGETDYQILILPGNSPVVGLNKNDASNDKLINLGKSLAYVVISNQPESIKIEKITDLEKLTNKFSQEFVLPTDDLVDYYQTIGKKKLKFKDLVRIGQHLVADANLINQRLRSKKIISKIEFDQFNRIIKSQRSKKTKLSQLSLDFD